MAEQLRPCPFCGSQPEFASSGIEDRDLAKCPKCNDLAWVSGWQTRTPPPATKAIFDLIDRCLDVAGIAEVYIDVAGISEVYIDESTAIAFHAEWAEPDTSPPDVTAMKPTPWKCCVCGKAVRIADDLRPHHIDGPTNHEAELSNDDLKTLADGLRLTD